LYGCVFSKERGTVTDEVKCAYVKHERVR